MSVRKDYGPQGACRQKAALLLLCFLAFPFLLLRLVWRKARRR